MSNSYVLKNYNYIAKLKVVEKKLLHLLMDRGKGYLSKIKIIKKK